MILLVAVIFSIAIALIRGGSFNNLEQVKFKYGWLAILAFALQAVIIWAPLESGNGLTHPRTLLLLGSYGILVAVVLLNRKLAGIVIIGLGLLLNLTVMVANDGFMPVDSSVLRTAGLEELALSDETGSRLTSTKDILLPREQTNLWVLSDIFVIPANWPLSTIFSIGDVFLAIGVFVFLQRYLSKSPAMQNSEQTSPVDPDFEE